MFWVLYYDLVIQCIFFFLIQVPILTCHWRWDRTLLAVSRCHQSHPDWGRSSPDWHSGRWGWTRWGRADRGRTPRPDRPLTSCRTRHPSRRAASAPGTRALCERESIGIVSMYIRDWSLITGRGGRYKTGGGGTWSFTPTKRGGRKKF